MAIVDNLSHCTSSFALSIGVEKSSSHHCQPGIDADHLHHREMYYCAWGVGSGLMVEGYGTDVINSNQ